MLRILGDLWDLGIESYNNLEESLHTLLSRRKIMRIKIIRKCKNGNFELKYYDQQLGCWLQAFETENNLRQGINEGIFLVEDSATTTAKTTDNSLLALARANLEVSK